jgi:hypothetical protein
MDSSYFSSHSAGRYFASHSATSGNPTRSNIWFSRAQWGTTLRPYFHLFDPPCALYEAISVVTEINAARSCVYPEEYP